MNLASPQIVFGYHGCVRWVAERIFAGLDADLEPTDGAETYHWLGRGVYFWENAPERAAEWAARHGARNAHKRHPALSGADLEPTVVGAVIHLGNCLNLLDIGGHETLAAAADRVLPDVHAIVDRAEASWRHTLDCLVINEACTNGGGPSRFDTVRGCFPEGNALFPGSHILSRTHVQICVRNPRCVVGYFRPKRGRVPAPPVV